MPVIDGLRDGVGVGFPPGGDNVVTAPWAPKVGDRAIDIGERGFPREGTVKDIAKYSDGLRYRIDSDDGWVRYALLSEIVPASNAVAAVVVRGLGCGETARVVLCRSEEEAAREQRANGGIVVGGDQVRWA